MSHREFPNEHIPGLRGAEEVLVTPETDDRDATVSWRNGTVWSTYTPALDDCLADVEDVLGLLLAEEVPLPVIRSSLALAYQDFDLDAWFRSVTMPNEAEWRDKDQAERRRRMEEFRDLRRRSDEPSG